MLKAYDSAFRCSESTQIILVCTNINLNTCSRSRESCCSTHGNPFLWGGRLWDGPSCARSYPQFSCGLPLAAVLAMGLQPKEAIAAVVSATAAHELAGVAAMGTWTQKVVHAQGIKE